MPADPNHVLKIDLASPTPAYRQIADALRAMLVSGQFKPGDRLPTVRQLAIDLAVHFNTAAQAYRLLSEEGWPDLRRRRGAVVVARPAQPARAGSRENFSRLLKELAARAVADGLDARAVAKQLDSLANEMKGQDDLT